MNIRSEPEVRSALDPGEPAHYLKSKVKRGYEIPKAGGQFRIPGVGRVKTLRHQESWNREMRNPENLKPKIGTPTKNFVDREITPFQSLRYRELKCRNTSSQECRNVESPKCETSKSQNRHTNKELRKPGNNSISESQKVSKLLTTGVSKRRNVKCMFRIGPWSMVTSSKRYREELEETSSISEFEAWRVDMTHHRNPKMRKCEIHF
jgi:hypothetical protein